MKVKAFYEQDFSDFSRRYSEQIINEISQRGKEYILNVNEDDYKNYLFNNYELTPLEILQSTEQIPAPSTEIEYYDDPIWGRRQREVYRFDVSYSFTGHPILFRLKPSTWMMTTFVLEIDDTHNKVSFSFNLYERNPEKFNQLKNQCYSDSFINIPNINKEVDNWNRQLPGIIHSYFHSTKDKHLKENDFFKAINIKVNSDTNSVFNAPAVKRKIIPQIPKVTSKQYTSEPTLNIDQYNDILKVIYDAGNNMEKKPALYIDKDEEGLRDQFIFILETRYDGITATGETFNRSGKTDILLKYAMDGSNIFVAECKFWHGCSEFHKAIDQLFDNYLTWRDSKAALMIFVKNNDFSKVISTVLSETQKHRLFVQSNGKRGDSSLSYIFCLPQDRDKKVFFEIMLFHYDKK